MDHVATTGTDCDTILMSPAQWKGRTVYLAHCTDLPCLHELQPVRDEYGETQGWVQCVYCGGVADEPGGR